MSDREETNADVAECQRLLGVILDYAVREDHEGASVWEFRLWEHALLCIRSKDTEADRRELASVALASQHINFVRSVYIAAVKKSDAGGENS